MATTSPAIPLERCSHFAFPIVVADRETRDRLRDLVVGSIRRALF